MSRRLRIFPRSGIKRFDFNVTVKHLCSFRLEQNFSLAERLVGINETNIGETIIRLTVYGMHCRVLAYHDLNRVPIVERVRLAIPSDARIIGGECRRGT